MINAAWFVLFLCFHATVGAQFTRELNDTLRLPLQPQTSTRWELVDAFAGGLTFTRPVAIASPPGETNRLFVLERNGRIIMIPDLQRPSAEVFMDISARVVASDWQTSRRTEGLSGVAFHPDFKSNGRFFVCYNTLITNGAGVSHYNRLAEFAASADRRRGLADSEIPLITQFDEGDGHNINDLHFGPDGYLYVAIGDEGDGGTGDDFRNAQKIDKDFFSAIMRIDVDKRPGNLVPNVHAATTRRYFVPADNPFVGATSFNNLPVDPNKVRTEFYAVGLRNPWRMSFDPESGALYVGDVGQHGRDEIDRIVKGGNYGWSYREGKLPGVFGEPPGLTLIDPIWDYPPGFGPFEGFSLTCGVVVRSQSAPELYGRLIAADYVSGNIWVISTDDNSPPDRLLGQIGISGFGYDPRDQSVLVVNHDQGKIFALRQSSSGDGLIPQTLSDTGIFDDLSTLQPNRGIYSYSLNVPFWSDGALKTRWFYVPPPYRVLFSATNSWTFPSGSLWVKHFGIETTPGVPASERRLETRVLVKNDAGIYGVSYKWDAEGRTATLAPESGEAVELLITNMTGSVERRPWRIPSRSECNTCHTPEAGYILGFTTAQLNKSVVHGGTATNQLLELASAGYFENPPQTVTGLHALATPTDASTSLRYRARSYLAANCNHCHQPAAKTLASWDARIITGLSRANIVNARLLNPSANPDERVVAAGDVGQSAIIRRMESLGSDRMPPLASTKVDQQGIELLKKWISEDLAGFESYNDWSNRALNGVGGSHAADDDPDADGIVNFAEYLLRGDPLSRDPFTVELLREGDQLKVTYDHPPGLGVFVQAAESLSPGSVAAPALPLRFPAAGFQETIMVPISTNTLFLRVGLIEP